MQSDRSDHSRPPSTTETPKHSSRCEERSLSRSPYGHVHSHSLTNTPKKFSSKKVEQEAWIKKLTLKLEDNRYKGGDKEAIKKLHELNRLENTSNKLLKRILNVIFISTGICLLLAVILVIVYTAIVKPDLSMNHHSGLSRQGMFKSVQDNSPVFYYGNREGDASEENPREVSKEDDERGSPDYLFVNRNSRQTPNKGRKAVPSSGCKLTAVAKGKTVQVAKICSDSESRNEFGEDRAYIEDADMK